MERLPPETQTGRRTFGCLVNGKLFKPKGSPFGGPILEAAYQYVEGGYSFQLAAKQRDDETLHSVGIFTDSLAIAEGQTIVLGEQWQKGAAAAHYLFSGADFKMHEYVTTSIVKGELHITKFDETAHIVSGTFWFDGVNEAGEKVEVREGRFDTIFSL